MTFKDICWIGGLLGALAVTLISVSSWLRWRRRAITRAAEALGFRPLAPGEKLAVVQVPIIQRANQTFFLILSGELGGYEAAYFELNHSSGKNWDLQSAVLLRSPDASVPRFQLQPKRFWQTSPRRCAEAVDLSTCTGATGLELTADDPEWARETFERVPRELLARVRQGKWSIEGRHQSLVIYRLGTRIGPRKWKAYMTEAADLASEFFRCTARTERPAFSMRFTLSVD